MKACPVFCAPERRSVDMAYTAQILDNEALLDNTLGVCLSHSLERSLRGAVWLYLGQ